MLRVVVFSLTFCFVWGMQGGCPAKNGKLWFTNQMVTSEMVFLGEAPWLVFIRNCGANPISQVTKEVHIIIQQPNELPMVPEIPQNPPPPIPTQKVTKKVPQRPKDTPPPIPTQKVTHLPSIKEDSAEYLTTLQTIQVILPLAPNTPKIASCPIPPYIPIQSLPPPEKVVPPSLRPMSHSGAQESYTRAPVGPQVHVV